MRRGSGGDAEDIAHELNGGLGMVAKGEYAQALACFAAKAVFNAQSVDDAATPTSPAKARRVELREKLLRAQAVPPADAPPPPHQWSGGELDDDDVEVDAPSPVRLPEAPAAPRP